MQPGLGAGGATAGATRKPAGSREPILQSYDDAVAANTLELASDGVRCRLLSLHEAPKGMGPAHL